MAGCRVVADQRITESQRNLVRFLRDCYEADNREAALFDLRHERVRHLHVLNHGADFLSGGLDLIPLDRKLAIEVQKSAQLYETERTLVFGAFLLVGEVAKPGPTIPKEELFAPLIFFPAAVEDADPHAFLRVDAREQRVNAKVLAALLGESESSSAYLDEILGRIPQAPFATHQLQDIISAFEEFLPMVDARELIHFPRLSTNLNMSKAGGPSAATGIRCLPACALALVPNSPDTRGVLTELAQVASARSWPAPLRALTGVDPTAPAAARRRSVRAHLPASLSHAQQKALHAAATRLLTLVIGPPGTGKSFTVATLTLDHVLRGQSVLLAARTSQALDVLADKIETLLGDRDLVLRGGRAGYTQELKESLAQWLEGPQAGKLEDDEHAVAIRKLEREVSVQARTLERLETALRQRADWEIQWGDDTVAAAHEGIVARWLRSCRLKLTDWQLARQGCYWDLMGNYQRQLETHHRTIAQLLQASIRHRRQQALSGHRREFLKLSKALRARTNRKQEEWFAQLNLDLLLRTFPVWLTPLSDAGSLLPFKPALFDLAVVDEATQCDLASCLPVFFRARRVVITGDPRQLRHVSFLSRERQRLLGSKWELSDADVETFDYREKSVLDWVNEAIPSQEQVVFLDEHFRSRPPIIAFSNREFYRGALKIMTQRPDTTATPSVEVRPIAGRREHGGPNREEADAVVAEVFRWVESEKDVPEKLAHSLGVLSPFREQVDHLFARLFKRLDLAAIKKHRLRTGTAHSFQGEERDIMFLSFVVDRDAHAGTLRYLDRPDVFNVSVTRARNLQIVFCSLKPAELPAKSLLRRYLEAIEPSARVDTVDAPNDEFLREVENALSARAYQTWPCYVVAGLPVDLLVAKCGRSLGIDLVGYPGHLADAFDLERYRLFQRAGLRLFPLSFSAWRKGREACLEAIDRWLAAVNCNP
jgi:hypothetical protein